MKNRIRNVAVMTLVLLFISGIYVFRNPVFTRYLPSIEHTGAVHIIVKNDTSYVNSAFIITNRSFLKIGIDTLKYDVTMFDKTYLKSENFIGLVLQGYGSDTVDFSLVVPYITILKDLKTERKKEDSAGYSINILLQYTTFLGKAEMPFNIVSKLKIPSAPEITIDEIDWNKIRFRSILANAKIRIINHGPIALEIKKLSYSMHIFEQGNLNGSYRQPIVIKPFSATFINLPITISVDHFGKTILDIILNKDKYPYSLNLHALMETTDPLKKHFKLDVIKDGIIELKK